MPEGTGLVLPAPLSLVAPSRGSDKECVGLGEIPTQVAGREGAFAIGELEGLNADFFCLPSLDRWDAKEGEDMSFPKDDLDSQVSS